MSEKSQFRKLIQDANIIVEAIGGRQVPPADVLSQFRHEIATHGYEASMKALEKMLGDAVDRMEKTASLILILDSETSAAKKPKKKAPKKKSTQKKSRNKK